MLRSKSEAEAEKVKMATGQQGASSVQSSVLLQMLLCLSGFYFLFYFLSSLSMLIYKSQVLVYPEENLVLDVCLLFMLAALQILRVYWGVRGNLQESGGYVSCSLISTGATVLLALYFLLWQSYVLRADVTLSAALLGLDGLGALITMTTLTRLRSTYS